MPGRHWNGHPVQPDVGIINYLLRETGADVNAKDVLGRTPLHWSAARDHRGVVEFLATHGGDVTAEDNEGWTPIHRAALPGRDWYYRNMVEPDVGIINYLLRETGAIVPFAKNVVEAHYKRERAPVAHRTRGAKRRQSSSYSLVCILRVKTLHSSPCRSPPARRRPVRNESAEREEKGCVSNSISILFARQPRSVRESE